MRNTGGKAVFILFFALWVVFNGRLTLEIALFGVVLSALLYAFVCYAFGFSVKKDFAAVKKVGKVIAYCAYLVKEIMKANLHVMKLILNQRYAVEPVLVKFKTRLHSDVAKAMLADSITLTPGTITVSVENDTYTVHCLDRELSQGLEGSEFEKKLAAIEGGESNA